MCDDLNRNGFSETANPNYKVAAFDGITSALSTLSEWSQELPQTHHIMQKDLTLIPGKLDYDTFLETILNICEVIGVCLEKYRISVDGKDQLPSEDIICDFLEFYAKAIMQMCMEFTADIITAGISEISLLDENLAQVAEELCPLRIIFYEKYKNIIDSYPAVTLRRYTGIGLKDSLSYQLCLDIANYPGAKTIEKIIKNISSSTNEIMFASTNPIVSRIIH